MNLLRKSQLFIGLLVGALCMLLLSCSTSISGPDATKTATGCTGTTGCTQSTSTKVGAGVRNVQVFVEPDAGSRVITNAINKAQQSVWLEMYLLTSRNVLNALEEAAQRNIDVRVMLEIHPYGSGGSISPAETMDRLKAAGVKVKATSPDFALTHEKGMIVDNKTAFVMTANFTLAALGGSQTNKNREYGIIDSNPQDVQAVSDIFAADWNRTTVQQISDPNIVVSPINARENFRGLIESATKTLQVEAEEMQDQEIEQALRAAVQRGVQVQVILPTPQGSDDHNSDGITIIKQGGVQVKQSTQLYMHAKLIIVDGQKAFVGSENISTASLNRNRELGILVSEPQVLTTLQQTFQLDWQGSQTP